MVFKDLTCIFRWVAADISKGNSSFIFSGQEVNQKWQKGFSGRDI